MQLLLHMLASLLSSFFTSLLSIFIDLPISIFKSASSSFDRRFAITAEGVNFYEGTIHHLRQRPIENSFTYPVRMALIDLDHPPKWWKNGNPDFLTAQEARDLVSLTGTVKLLANPPTAGYTQNPIAVYYCYSEGGALETCVAVVQNTPWGAKVTFAFKPEGESVPKALHVSPFMDMQNTWHIKATRPGKRVSLLVAVSHKEHGEYFLASLQMRLADLPQSRSEEAGLSKLLRYGYQPQRAALLIYWQALKLLWKGAPIYGPPDAAFQTQVLEQAGNTKLATEKAYHWDAAQHFPWNVDQ